MAALFLPAHTLRKPLVTSFYRFRVIGPCLRTSAVEGPVVRVRNSSPPTFSRECGVSGEPQAAVLEIGVDFDALVSASTFPTGSRRTKSLVARM